MQFDPDSLIRIAEFSYQIKNKFAETIYFMDTNRAEMATSKALTCRKARSKLAQFPIPPGLKSWQSLQAFRALKNVGYTNNFKTLIGSSLLS